MATEHGFVATEFSSVEDKEKFAAQFKQFVSRGYTKSEFSKWFYKRLSMTFGHIAHYSQDGFYSHFFGNGTRGILEFVRECLSWPCHGEPTFTFSDVERHLQAWLRENQVIEKLNDFYLRQVEGDEKDQLARLRAKYEQAPSVAVDIDVSLHELQNLGTVEELQPLFQALYQTWVGTLTARMTDVRIGTVTARVEQNGNLRLEFKHRESYPAGTDMRKTLEKALFSEEDE